MVYIYAFKSKIDYAKKKKKIKRIVSQLRELSHANHCTPAR